MLLIEKIHAEQNRTEHITKETKIMPRSVAILPIPTYKVSEYIVSATESYYLKPGAFGKEGAPNTPRAIKELSRNFRAESAPG